MLDKEISIFKANKVNFGSNFVMALWSIGYRKSSKDYANIFSNFSLFGETIYWGISKTIKLRKSFLSQKKALDTGVSKMAFKKSKISLIGMLPEPIRNQLKLGVAIFWGRLIFDDLL